MNGIKDFLAHIGPRPGKGYSLDRIDNDKGYEPGNVRWATTIQQAANKRKRARIEQWSDAEIRAEFERRGLGNNVTIIVSPTVVQQPSVPDFGLTFWGNQTIC